MLTARNVLAAIAGGVVGALVNSVAVGAATGAAFLPLLLSPGRHAGAVVFSLLLVPIFWRWFNAPAWLAAVVALTAIPTLLAKAVFGVDFSWGTTAAFNLVYAVAATLVYKAATPGEETAEA